MKKLQQCARDECKHSVRRRDARFCSATCGQLAARAESITKSSRRLVGNESRQDAIERENIELRGDIKKCLKQVEQYEKGMVLEDRLIREIKDYVEANPYRPVLNRSKRRKASSSDHEMLALVSDAHYPEVVDPASAFGLRYNAAICKTRIEYLRDTIVRYRDLRASAYPVRKLTLGVIGDMLSGNIHEELEISNERPMSEALVEMGQMLFGLGLSCAESFEEVEMIVMPGNHPRIHKFPRFKAKWDNWEYVMAHYVKALAGDKFIVTVPKDLVYRHVVFNKTIGLTHGDGVKAQGFGGIPFYSLEKRQTKLQALLKSVQTNQLDMLCYGHFHQLLFQEGMGCSVIINGSIKGGDEYSIGTMYSAQEPVQALLTFHANHGLTDLSRINLGHIF